MTEFSQEFREIALGEVHDVAAERHAAGWRYVQILAVNTEAGVDLVYSYMLDGLLENDVVRALPADAVVPSITDLFLEAFVCENEIHDLFDVAIQDIAIDFGGMFYQLSQKAPMTVVSPEQLAAREKARKVVAAKAAKEAAAKQAPEAVPDTAAPAAGPTEEEIQAKIAGLPPEKAAKVRAAMEAKAKKAAVVPAADEAPAAPKPAGLSEEEIQAKIAGLDPEKAAKVRAALEAKAAKAAKTEGKGE